jgi:hypothetical protein
MNWTARIENLKRIISSWEKRNLSIMGKICIIKTFLVSQFVYFMQSFIIPENILIEVNRILFRFLWRKRDCNKRAFEKVKRNVMCSEYGNGGLNMIDLRIMQRSFLLQWVTKLCGHATGERWQCVPRHCFRHYGDKLICFYVNVKSSLIKGLDEVHSQFWRNVLIVWLRENKPDIDTACSSLIWNNINVVCQGKVLFFSDWVKGNILFIDDFVKDNGIITYEEVCDILGRAPQRLLEYNVVQTAIRRFRNRNIEFLQPDLDRPPPFCSKFVFSCSEFRKMICNRDASVPICQGLWLRKYDILIEKREWNLARECTSETRLRLLQWKILHNIYPTNILLSKMHVKENHYCSFCPETIDFIEHFFFHCAVVQNFWKDIQQTIYINYNALVQLQVTDVLFGIYRNDISMRVLNKINYLILLGKCCISIYKKTNAQCPLQIIFEKQASYRKLMLL